MAKVIMIQGTMSNAGKSLFTAGLCRIFKEDGYRVAPFKAQNMALNSYITKEGLEMGRAQVVQAEAAGIVPRVIMNPILLKPTSDKGSQVIVNGEVLGNYSAEEYYQLKEILALEVKKAYDVLADEFEIIVIEGAGSPAEINLMDKDLVNMGMARMADAPVLLVGDIDRGGVFAALYGTIMLLPREDRKYIKGMIINKFRGDEKLLQPGLRMIEELTDIPVIGVMPYIHIDIEDEDSLSGRLSKDRIPDALDIAVVHLPRISNFTDFNVFEQMEGVSLRYVKSVSDLKNPDLIIIPGTKNTMGDLLYIRQNGLEVAILKHVAKEKPVFGICGGFQMMGIKLSDPDGVEHGGEMAGLGIFNTETVFEKEKIRTQVAGNFGKVPGIFSNLSGLPFEGYEIHMGVTKGEEMGILTKLHTIQGISSNKEEGRSKGNAYGSYVHGIFDKEGIAIKIIRAIAEEKGISTNASEVLNFQQYKEEQYHRLAEEIRKAIPMNKIYEILNKEG
jgi:adenosylcobyric acid synthase